jgi:hypothetical protein
LVEVAEDGGEAYGEEDSQDGDTADDKDEDGDAAAGTVATEEVRCRDAVDYGREDDGEECADVEDFELFGELVCEEQSYEDTEEKQDVAMDANALLLCLGGRLRDEVGLVGSQRALLIAFSLVIIV